MRAAERNSASIDPRAKAEPDPGIESYLHQQIPMSFSGDFVALRNP
jgi:hypothetical protein